MSSDLIFIYKKLRILLYSEHIYSYLVIIYVTRFDKIVILCYIIVIINFVFIKGMIVMSYTMGKSMLYGDYLKCWLKLYKAPELKRTSYDRLERTINTKIIPVLGNKLISEITSEDIQSLIFGLTFKGYSHSLIKKTYDTLKASFTYAVINDHITKSPMLSIKPPSIKNNPPKEMRIFTDDEIKTLVMEMKKEYGNGKPIYRYGYAYLLMLHTGIRVGECLALKKSDYNVKRKTICIHSNIVSVTKRDENYNALTGFDVIEQNTPKTQSSRREIFLNETAQCAINKLLEYNTESKYIVSAKNNSFVDPQQFRKAFYNLLKNCGVEKTGLHSLRHTFASKMFQEGCNIKVVSKILGHSSVKITYDTYVHLLETQVSDAVYCLDKAFAC